MSWSLSVSPTPKADFYDAVDAATVQFDVTPQTQEQIDTAKAVAKEFAKAVDSDDLEYLSASLSGHVHNAGTNDALSTISVYVGGCSAP